MKYILCLFLIVIALRINAAYWIGVAPVKAGKSDATSTTKADSPETDSNDLMSYPEDDDALDTMAVAKRANCMRWGMVCIQNGRYKFMNCCGGLNCMCNVWKTYCRCRAKLG